jgi:hypothetical protein
VIKEKIDRYYKESMVPPKLVDVSEPKIYITIGKLLGQPILDLRYSVSAILISLCDHLDLPLLKVQCWLVTC